MENMCFFSIHHQVLSQIAVGYHGQDWIFKQHASGVNPAIWFPGKPCSQSGLKAKLTMENPWEDPISL